MGPVPPRSRAHSRRFLKFDGLESFHTKLHPDRWEPLYAIANRPAFPAATLYAICAAMFGAASPVPVFARALAAAARQEVHTLFNR